MFEIHDDYYTNWKNFEMQSHQHGFLELNYVVSGECEYQVKQNTYLIEKKNLFILNSSLPHKLILKGNQPCIILGIALEKQGNEEAFLDKWQEIKSFLSSFEDAYLIKDGYKLSLLMKDLIAEKEGDAEKGYIELLITRLLIEIARAYHQKNTSLSVYPQEIKKYIQYHYFEITCLEDIAKEIGINKVYMQRVFKMQEGLTLWEYVNEVRMKNALILLRDTNIPIGEIDAHLGIGTRQTFYLLFKKKYGISPEAYRKEMQK